MNGLRQLNAVLAVALMLCTPVAVGCHEPEPPKETRVRVEAGPPRVKDVDVTLRYPVELQADETVSITPVAISGFLRRVLVDVGDKVKGGQLIALVDCREYQAQRTQAETVIAKRVAQVEESRSQLRRLERMGESLVAPAEIDRAAASARVAEAELADARAKLSEAGQRQGYCSLTAPFSGFVTERFLDPGAMVSPGGRPVVNIVKTRDVRVVVSVIEADAPKIARGVEVEVVLNAFPYTPFPAQVARVGRSLDPATRTLRVEMDIPNRTELLLPGMTGRASIVVDRREDALLVPITAVLQLEETAYVYVIDEQDRGPTAHRIPVKLGVDQGDWIEVREGLKPTDQVIMVGRELVGEGTKVEVASAPPASSAESEPPAATGPAPSPGEAEAAAEVKGDAKKGDAKKGNAKKGSAKGDNKAGGAKGGAKPGGAKGDAKSDDKTGGAKGDAKPDSAKGDTKAGGAKPDAKPNAKTGRAKSGRAKRDAAKAGAGKTKPGTGSAPRPEPPAGEGSPPR